MNANLARALSDLARVQKSVRSAEESLELQRRSLGSTLEKTERSLELARRAAARFAQEARDLAEREPLEARLQALRTLSRAFRELRLDGRAALELDLALAEGDELEALIERSSRS